MKEKNAIIELYRLFLVISICLHHFRLYSSDLPYGGGYLATDCFFVLSGFFLGKRIERNSERSDAVWDYIKTRYLRLWPQYAASFALSAILYMSLLDRDLGGNMLEYVSEFFMLPVFNSNLADRIIPPDWYVGVLLFASCLFVLLICAFRHKKSAYVSIVLLTAFAGYVYLGISKGNLCAIPSDNSVLATMPLIRALSGVGLGILINYITVWCSEKCMSICLRRLIVVIFTVIEAYLLLWYKGWSIMDFVAVFLFVVILALVADVNGFENERINELICQISRLSYMIYLNHYLVAYVFSKYRLCECVDWKYISLLYLICVIGYSEIVYGLYLNAHKLVKRFWSRFFKVEN